MGWLNGKAVAEAPEMNGRAGANVSALAPAEPVASQALTTPNNQGITAAAEVARFMPVMDIEQALQRHDVIVQAMKRLMKDGVDYGKIPGCGDKPALLQPGADKLCNLFGLTVRYQFLAKEEDWTGANHCGEAFFYYQISALVYRGDFLLAEGVGACSSWESKYRWRNGERTCPACGNATIIKGREEYGGGWLCFKRKGGCGALFSDTDPAIVGQQVGRKPNPDLADSVNTILKIAYKRAKLSGTINATSASEFFTQDVEDFSIPEPVDIGDAPPNSRAAQQHVVEQKLRTGNIAPIRVVWKGMRAISDDFKTMRERVGEVAWLGELERYGWRCFQDIVKALDSAKGPAKDAVMSKVADCYDHLNMLKGGN